MKMPTLPKMKMPKLPKLPKPQPKRLQATARRAAQPAVDDYDEEPTTRLSSAFVVVLILHVVAVGGIYAFNSIKAHRRGQDVVSAPTPAPVKSSQQPAVNSEPATQTTPAEPAAAVVRNAETPISTPVVTTKPVADATANPVTPVSPISGNRIHHVRPGDTLTRVAALYNVSVSDLEEINGLKPGAVLRPKQALNIPASKQTETKTTAAEVRDPRKIEATVATKKTETPVKPVAATSKASTKTYTVKKGENPVIIAKRFGVSYDELLKINKITDPKKLRVGQVLTLPAK